MQKCIYKFTESEAAAAEAIEGPKDAAAPPPKNKFCLVVKSSFPTRLIAARLFAAAVAVVLPHCCWVSWSAKATN